MTHITYPAQMDCGNGTPMWRALELAWDAYCAGSFPVGAVLTDPDGVIVAEGRNHAGESIAPDGLMRGTVIAHAEMSVLAQLPQSDYADYTLWTTLEPCLLCQAAATMSHIGHVRYLAPDSICDGLDALPSINAHAKRRYPEIVGPGVGAEATFASVLPMAVLASSFRYGFAVGHYVAWSPAAAAAALRIVDDGLWPSRDLGLNAAIDHVAALGNLTATD